MSAYPLKELVGLVPAAGAARRISPLPCSKEILPVGYWVDRDLSPSGTYTGTPIHFLLEQVHLAGASRVFIVISPEKTDLLSYLQDGAQSGTDLAFLVTREPWGVPFTLDRAFRHIETATVIFGFPDILVDQPGAFDALLGRLQERDEDIVLGVFTANAPTQEDLVAMDDEGRVQRLDIKAPASDLAHAWILAAWRPRFSRFIRDWTNAWRRENSTLTAQAPEPHLGTVINAAIAAELKVGAVTFDAGRYLDIGTPQHLAMAATFVDRSYQKA